VILMAKLKPWYQAVTPREDLRENRPLDAPEFAVHLDHIRDERAHEDYVKPDRYFERTRQQTFRGAVFEQLGTDQPT
jgi:hypothetical protein